MKLDLDEEQGLLRDSMRAFLEDASPIERVRSAEPRGFDSDLWAIAAEIGLPGACLPDELGGGAGDVLSAAIIAEEMGRTVAPIPVVEHWASTRLAAALFPDATWVPDLVRGAAPATLALSPLVDGQWRMVPAGAAAPVVLGWRSSEIVATRGTPSGLIPNHASAPLGHRAVDEVLGVAAENPIEAWARAVDEWKTWTAGLLVGVASRALEIGVTYVQERHQFGKPIGAFQSIQHQLADLVAPIDGARLLTAEAAWTCDQGSGPERRRLASMALLFSAEIAREATSVAVHVHGGYGVMEEYDIQLYYRRARGWPLILGDPEAERQSLADHLFAPASDVVVR